MTFQQNKLNLDLFKFRSLCLKLPHIFATGDSKLIAETHATLMSLLEQPLDTAKLVKTEPKIPDLVIEGTNFKIGGFCLETKVENVVTEITIHPKALVLEKLQKQAQSFIGRSFEEVSLWAQTLPSLFYLPCSSCHKILDHNAFPPLIRSSSGYFHEQCVNKEP